MEKSLSNPFKSTVNLIEIGLLILLVFSGLMLAAAPLLNPAGVSNQNSAVLVPWLVGFFYFICSVWIFGNYRSLPAARTYTLLTLCISLALATWNKPTGSVFSTAVWTFGIIFGTSTMMLLAFRLFPTQSGIPTRRTFILSGVIASIAWLAVFLFFIFITDPEAIRFVTLLLITLAGLSMVFFLSWVGIFALKRIAPGDRQYLTLLIIGTLLSFVPPVLAAISLPLWPKGTGFSVWWLTSMVIFPVTTGFFIQSRQKVSADVQLSRSAAFGLLSALIVFGYALLVTGAGFLLSSTLGPSSVIIQGVLFFGLALLFNPLQNYLQNRMDRAFFRSHKALDEELLLFSNALTHQMDAGTLVKTIRQTVDRALAPAPLHIFLYDTLSDQYLAAPGADQRPTSDLRYATSNPLVSLLSESHSVRSISGLQDLPTLEKSRLQLLGAAILVPLPGQNRPSGWLVLGPRRSTESYTSREKKFLEGLADQASLAIERSRVVDSLENRVHEMNVLGRIAQGVNITLQMDDIFELIYAQTTQIIHADDFYLMLLHPETGELIDTFHVESDDRLSDKEQKSVARDVYLEEVVARSGHSLLVENYTAEAHRRGLTGERPGVIAWMGVPLNAGAGSIGVISMGSRDQSTVYTQEQLNLLQRIADQAAGAIVKARLLAESERRTRQLTTLNEVTRQLTSTLELEPLLSIILDSATELLSCEAGSLLLVDSQTDELVFRVVTGPAKANLTGKRMPPGAGVVGKCVKMGQPIIVNDVQSSPDWFKYVDEQTGFITRALLVVPLEVKGNIIGVIEVINKRGSSSFTQEDQNLLSAFASQAGIAIENARLYTMTDQALAARVEELSVMQRIDRELNASLEVNRALTITLDWALRQSRANAGIIGQVDGDVLRIIASQGYTNELDSLDQQISLDHFSIQQAVESGTPLRLNLEGALLTSSRTLAIIPIRREDTTLAVILLESSQPDALDVNTLAFLARLSDHASIAISNAQLYAAVQSANVAKSEFVSFVAHELKNPMTSIKGYTELLAAGAVGPVNEAQANFLTTIRSNVERMSTLVSDLNDVTRIEANRMRLDFKAQSLKEIVDETVRSLRKQIEDKGQVLNLCLADDLPSVWADRTRLAQVVTNLVSNAFKYTQQGGTITVGAEVCDNQWDPAGARRVVHIWVQDTGIGISLEDQKKIFQKFFRSEDPKTREAPGTGLGLNITRSLVELQGGKIWFESEFRVGTTFHFTVPVAE